MFRGRIKTKIKIRSKEDYTIYNDDQRPKVTEWDL